MYRVVCKVLFVVLITGCGGEAPPEPADSTDSISIQGLRSEHKATQPVIPNDLEVVIIEQSTLKKIKRSLGIRLNQKVSKDVLRVVALELRNSDPISYERTFIEYYLPGMRINAGVWATTHFNPTLDVKILGLTIEQEQTIMAKELADPAMKIIGAWLDERPLGHSITIFYRDDKIYMERKFPDGSSGVEEMVEKDLPEGKRLEGIKENDFDEYYLIDNNNELQYWDKDGLFYTAQKQNKVQSEPVVTRPMTGPVNIEAKATHTSDGRISIYGKSNLPDGTELLVSLVNEKTGFQAQDTSAISNGKFSFLPLGSKTGLNPGDYVVNIIMPLPHVQPEHVKRIIGDKGQYLSGPLVSRDDSSDSNIVEISFSFDIGSAQ
ncbi:MAG: hypothetical protein V3W31_03950 [Thermodesulfobacteriota bacterium]